MEEKKRFLFDFFKFSFRMILFTFGILFITLIIHEYVHIKQAQEPYAVCYDLGLYEDTSAFTQGENFNELGIVKYFNNTFIPKLFIMAVHFDNPKDPIEVEAYFIDSVVFIFLMIIVFITEKVKIVD